jgi:ABC-type nitrate/sulfonate/bicarbonate transport system substrate-binding protein
MDKVHFPYRAKSHLPFLHVVAESGAWEKNGLQVEYDYRITAEDAHKHVASGEVEFVGGNHLSPYARRTQGDRWVYLAQTMNLLNHRMVVRADSEISKVSDLKGKVVGVRGEHPGGNTWVFIRQNGLEAHVQLEEVAGQGDWEVVRDGKVDAAFVTPPSDLFARRAGLKVIDVEYLPMVWFTTVSSALPFVEKHPDIVDKFLKGIIEGIAFFKTHRNESIKIIQSKGKPDGALAQETATHLYEQTANVLLAKPYASLQAISNAYEIAKRVNKDAAKVEPMELWNFHFLRRIDDSGFIDNLYKL